MFDRPLAGRLWPIHLKPYDDEALSSWVLRLGRAYGADLGRLCTGHPIAHRDLDKGLCDDLLTVLAEKTATPPARVWDTTLRGYPGFPHRELRDNGLSSWVLSIGLRKGRRQRPWLQYCPRCLQEDPDPYFRRRWRLAFVTVCPIHGCRLLDRCSVCGAPCNSDRLPPEVEAITQCHRCRFDARCALAPALRGTADHSRVMRFQNVLIEALQRGWCPLARGETVATTQYLAVLAQLGRLLMTRNHAQVLRAGFCQHLGEPYFAPAFASPKARALEALTVDERFPLMLLLGWWLDDWPEQFVAMCAMAKLTVTELRRDFQLAPDWYQEAVGQVARGRFAGLKFARYDTATSVATPFVNQSQQLL